jgi:hypothetical protein
MMFKINEFIVSDGSSPLGFQHREFESAASTLRVVQRKKHDSRRDVCAFQKRDANPTVRFVAR